MSDLMHMGRRLQIAQDRIAELEAALAAHGRTTEVYYVKRELEEAIAFEREACARSVESCAGAVAIEIGGEDLAFGEPCCSKQTAKVMAAVIRARGSE